MGNLSKQPLRQTADCLHSCFDGTAEQLLTLISDNFRHAERFRDGVLMVPLPPERFRTSVTQVTADTPLEAECKARREGEEPFITVTAVAPRARAKTATVILFRKDILGSDASTDADYEVVSIRTSVVEDGEPMHPVAMATNFLGLPGGTQADYTAEQFAKAILFWARHAIVMLSQEIDV